MTKSFYPAAPILLWIIGVFMAVTLIYFVAAGAETAACPALRSCQMEQVHDADGTSRWRYPCHEETLQA